MEKLLRSYLAIVFLLLAFSSAQAAHLVGGEMDYECLGNNQYRIHLRIYRDCNSGGADFDQLATITIYDINGNIVQNLQVPHGAEVRLPAVTNNPCLQSPPNICTEYTDYYANVTLPPIAGGYTITHQRCCRNNTIANIPNPGTWGNTYSVNIPSNDVSCNSSPRFTSEPPIVLCLNDPLNIDASVIEPDGDSIYYELCSPLHGGGQTTSPPDCGTCVKPDPATAPPYIAVPFNAPQSAANPIPSNPTFSINPNTGMLTGTPNQLGQYVFAICVSEFRNGQRLSTISRDYQFNVTNCQSNVRSDIISQIIIPNSNCSGRTVAFQENAINATTFFWDFGDPLIASDTSNQPNPTYTFNDTGIYTVTLIVNKGEPCADTATAVFEVRNPVVFTVTSSGNPCFDIQNFIYAASGNFSADAQYEWTFPPQANIQQFSGANPPPINFNATGSYWVELEVTDFGCTSTYGDSIIVTERPFFTGNDVVGTFCAPYELDLGESVTSTLPVYYEWIFGDGTTSNQPDPQKVYNIPGTYNGSLLMYTLEGCADSAFFTFEITIYPSAQVTLNVSPTKTDIFNPYVDVTITDVEPDESFAVAMGDGSSYTNLTQFRHKYSDTGWYEIRVVADNIYGCGLEQLFLFRVAPIPLIYTPDAFTPNGDGLNDGFRSFSSGYSEFRLDIYDRWGNLVFRSVDAFEWWDGVNENTGEPSPQGTYVWVVKFRSTEGEYIERKGTVTLLR